MVGDGVGGRVVEVVVGAAVVGGRVGGRVTGRVGGRVGGRVPMLIHLHEYSTHAFMLPALLPL